MYSNYMPTYQPYQQSFGQFQHYEIIHVNGENGAKAFQMSPNSNVLLLDDTAPVVWLATTDGAGYKEIRAFDIVPHESEEAINVKSLEERIKKLEEMFNESDKLAAKRNAKTTE